MTNTPSTSNFSMTLRSHRRNGTSSPNTINNAAPTGDTNDQANTSNAAENNTLRAPRGEKRSNIGDINEQDQKRPRLDNTSQTENNMGSPSEGTSAAPNLTLLNTQRTMYTQNAINNVKPSTDTDRQALMNCVENCFANSARAQINRQAFPAHSWQKPGRINENTAAFCNTLAQAIAEVSNAHLQNQASGTTPTNAEAEAGAETVMREAVIQAFDTLGNDFTLEEPLSFFVFDTETNRLFGDVVSMGWVRLDVKSKTDHQIECRNCLLPPNFVAYGAERVHKMNPEWLKAQHADGHSTTPETTARKWLEHAMASKSVIGFNLLYDLNAVKRLFHSAGVDRNQVDKLMEEIGKKFSVDVQDFLLRVDPVTRHDHKLPFSDTKPSHKFASDNFDDQYADGDPINYMPNRKLVSYAEGFLGMQTEGAHDALYDCVMTLASYAQSLGLRNEVLNHEQEFTRKSDKRLSTYDRKITPSESLSRRINAPAASKTEDRPIYLQADSASLIQNPALKSTPFIYKPTGPTIHRRHIIPKSTLASLLLPNQIQNNLAESNKLYRQLVNHPNFNAMAQERLSDTAQTICQGFKQASFDWGEYDDTNLVNAVSDFVKGIEKAQDKDISIRYFERDPAKQFLEGLPASGDIEGSGTVSLATMHQVMGAILYSFYHSLEFNQFIGSGAENVVAGRLFHNLEKLEPDTLNQISQANDTNTIKDSLTHWLEQVQSVLNIGASDTSQDDVETQVMTLLTPPNDSTQTKPPKVSSETVLYFLEMRQAINNFLSTFMDFNLPDSNTPVRTNSLESAQAMKSDVLGKIDLISAIGEHRETEKRYTFGDRNWLHSLKTLHQTLSNTQTQQEIDTALTHLTQGLRHTQQSLNESDLYEGDKTLLSTLILDLLGNREIKPDLLTFEPNGNDANPGITDFSRQKSNDHLSKVKNSVSSFIKAIRDNTAYDIPSNASRALQNSYLLPLYQLANQSETPSFEEKTIFFNGLLEADAAIANKLNVTRQTDANKPLYGNYMPYMY